jgi:hypothetical protein
MEELIMSVKMRQEVERKIAAALIDSALKAGYTITVNDGEEDVLKRSASADAILKAMFTTDEDRLYLHAQNAKATFGWVLFIYGNDGWDVISDYTTNLEPIMGAANKLADYYGD